MQVNAVIAESITVAVHLWFWSNIGRATPAVLMPMDGCGTLLNSGKINQFNKDGKL